MPRLFVGVAHGQNEDVARAAALGDDVDHLGLLHRGLASTQPAHDLDATAGAHAARHRDRRQHEALLGVAIEAKIALQHRLGADEGEPVRRQFAALLERVGIEVEGAGGAAHGH